MAGERGRGGGTGVWRVGAPLRAPPPLSLSLSLTRNAQQELVRPDAQVLVGGRDGLALADERVGVVGRARVHFRRHPARHLFRKQGAHGHDGGVQGGVLVTPVLLDGPLDGDLAGGEKWVRC